MKKVFLLSIFAVFAIGGVHAQEAGTALSEGSWVIEANTGSGSTDLGSTSFGLSSVDGSTVWSVGAEAGYFVKENFAIKAGLGYQDLDVISSFSYKVGAKYYIASEFPVGIDYVGSSVKDLEENASYIGLEGGYAWFIADNVSIEPKLRYNLSMNSDFYEDAFQFLIGFAIHI